MGNDIIEVDIAIRRHANCGGLTVFFDQAVGETETSDHASCDTYLQALCQAHAYIEDLIKKERTV